MTAAAGVVTGVEVWLQLPLHRLRFQDAGGARTRVGAGDPRVSLRVGAAHWELAIERLTGGDLEQQGLKLPTARRRLVQLLPTIGWSHGTWQMEFTGRFNLEGRNLPDGPSFSAGVLFPWSL